MTKHKDPIETTSQPEGGEQAESRSERPAGIGRRRFLQAGAIVAGSAAYMAPRIASSQAGLGSSPAGPIPLPFNLSGPIPGGPFAGTVGSSNYQFTGTTSFQIDVDGNVTIQSSVLTGTYISGINHGPVTLTQDGILEAPGGYDGTNFHSGTASNTMTYTDTAHPGGVSVSAIATGTINTAQNSVTLSAVGVEVEDVDIDIDKDKQIG